MLDSFAPAFMVENLTFRMFVVFYLQKTQEEPVEYTASGRVKRKTASNVTYKEEDDSQDFDLDLLLEQMEAQEKK